MMTYNDYLETIKDVEPSDKFKFTQAILWLHREKLPMGLISLGDDKIEKVKVPAFVKNQYDITVPVIAISSMAFSGNTNVTDVILPPSIERFPQGVFSGCTALRNITIPRKIKIIKEGTFKGCVNLENIFYEGTPEEWGKIKIVHQTHEIEFGTLIPGTPTQTVISEKSVNIPGNEAIFSANIHFRCKL